MRRGTTLDIPIRGRGRATRGVPPCSAPNDRTARAPEMFDQLRDGGLPPMASRAIGGSVTAIVDAGTGPEPAAGGGGAASGPPGGASRGGGGGRRRPARGGPSRGGGARGGAPLPPPPARPPQRRLPSAV